jgi:23S rRNA-/tRNA-specific pseudouridylate synthase
MSIRILSDDEWLVLDKPAGVSVHNAAEGEQDVLSWLRREKRDERPVHRIDKGTSGLLLCASRERAAQASAWFVEGRVQKMYLAMVSGKARNKGVIRRALKEGGQRIEATTRYRCVERFGSFSLLEVRTETGRKHQIRRHLQSIGLPLVGDDRYGPRRPRPIKGFPGRLWLHAAWLELPMGEEFESPLPSELEEHLSLLRSVPPAD